MSEFRIGYQPGTTWQNNVINYLERHRKQFPDRVCLRWVDRADVAKWDGKMTSPLPHSEITYGDFAKRIDAISTGLQKLGVGHGDRIIIFLPMGWLLYSAMFAVQRLGAIAVFLESWARRGHLGASAECVQPKGMISFKQAFDLIKEVPEFQSMPMRIIAGPGNDGTYTAQLEELLRTPGCPELDPVESEHTALITFTTGSSGKPKGANRTHRFLAAQHEALREVVPYTPEDSDLPAFPVFSLNNLASGVTTLVPALDLAQPSEMDAALLTAQILQQKITCSTLSPSMLVNVAKYCADNGIKLTSLRRVGTGGAPISRDNVRDFKAIAPQSKVWVLYGSTEVEPMAHIEADEMLSLPVNPDPEIVEEGVNVGHVSDTLRYKFLKIVDGPIDLNNTSWKELELPRGQVGEFIVTGDHVCRDYYNDEEGFRKAKIRDHDGAIWHRTGDLARLDDEGYLWMVGRIHNVIRRGDEYHFPVRAEVILKRLPYVKQCAFLALPDKKWGEKTAIAVALDHDKLNERGGTRGAREDILRHFEKNRIPVDSLFFVERVPLDPRHHSKVEYDELRKELLEGKAKDVRNGL